MEEKKLKTKKVKKILLFIVLILGGLILTGGSPVKKRVIDPTNKDVFIVGELSFKGSSDTIKFWVEGDKGKYSLLFFQEGKDTTYTHLTRNTAIVERVFRKEIRSSIRWTILEKDKTSFFIIDFTNKEFKGKEFNDGIKLVKKIEKETQGHISGYLIIIFGIKVVVKK